MWFAFYVLLQILITRNIVLFNYAFCFVYIGAILLLPAEVNRTFLLILGFLTGLVVDVFYNTLGLHAAATLLVAYLKPFWVDIQLETKGATDRVEITLSELGIGTFLTYLLPLVVIHHATLFFIEMSHFGMLGYTLLRIVASVAFTTLFIVIIQLFSKR
ncbi:hypothetical protein ACFFSP_09050 [Persicitalea jodogahamensis]